MTNPYFNPSGNPITGGPGASAAIRGEFAAIAAGFALLPALTAGKAVIINGSGTAMTTTAGGLSLAADFALTGGGNLTLQSGSSVTLIAPGASTTIVGTDSAQALTNKTYNGLTITPAAATLSITAGKTLAVANSMTLASTDGATINLGGGGTLSTVAYSGSASDLGAGTLPVARLSGSYTGITGVGTVAAGVWQGTKIGLAFGGTNADLSATGGTSQVLRQSSAGAAVTVAQLAFSDVSGTIASGQVSGAYSGITGVGTVAAGVWQGTKIGLAFGGTNADLSATGGTSNVLRQSSAGAAVTVGQLAASDLSNGTTGTGAVVLAASPTHTGTVAAASMTLSGTLGLTGALTYGGTTLSAAVTGTGAMVLANSPTLVSPSLGTVAAGVWQGTKIGLAFGGTNADLSATGGASNVLKQVSAGAAVTVAQLAFTDVSGTATAAQGGTGVNGGAAANGSLLIGNGAGYALATITPGFGITVTNASGAVTIVNSGWTTGDVKWTYKTTPDTGWIMVNDGTIGDATSGGTNRANADTVDLFTLLWNNCTNANAPVLPAGRGASAAADFAAHKTIGLPKSLGRAMGVSGAGSGLTSRALGEALGAETHAHTASSGGPNSLIGRGDTGGGINVADQFHGHAITVDAGSSMQPTAFLNGMIKL